MGPYYADSATRTVLTIIIMRAAQEWCNYGAQKAVAVAQGAVRTDECATGLS